LEDAGWEIFDSALAWMYGEGFPKGHRQSRDFQIERHGSTMGMISNTAMLTLTLRQRRDLLDLERQWEGWNVALKPSCEPIILCRAPRTPHTFAGLARTFGTGALAIDAARVDVATDDPNKRRSTGGYMDDGPGGVTNFVYNKTRGATLSSGRWPANTILVCACDGDGHDAGCPVAVLDVVSGDRPSSGRFGTSGNGQNTGLFGMGSIRQQTYFDEGGASRFYYTAKAGGFERAAGLQDFTPQTVGDGREKPIDNAYQRGKTQRRLTHPTVKPIQLTEYIARLLLPPPLDTPRHVLIPFAGVLSEAIGAHLAGWDMITAIELTADYMPQGRARWAWWSRFSSYEQARSAWEGDKAEQDRRADEAAAGVQQLGLFEVTP
jgi:site-specific DNA-methyltransferase (adenine-specific)